MSLSQGYGLELVPPGSLDHQLAPNLPQADSAPAGRLPSASQQAELRQPTTEPAGRDFHPCNGPVEQHSAALHSTQFPEGAPSLVGSTYMGVQGGQQISVGATKQFGFTAEQALQECGRQVTDDEEVAQAEALLRPRAESLWDPASSWQVTATSCFVQQSRHGSSALGGMYHA